MGILSDAASSILGNPKKAIIMIRKPESPDTGLHGLFEAAQSALSMASKGFSTIAGAMSGGYYSLEVQYNPSSISYYSRAGGIPMQSMQNGSDINGLVYQQTEPTENVMSVELIFDDVNNKDAFMLEKTRLSAGDIVQSGMGLYKNLLGGGYTVKPEINSFIGMVMREDTRYIIFQWADMSFYGEIVGVNASYTMFSVSGKPIRGTVKLNIRQEVSAPAEIVYWNKAFEKCFGKAKTGLIKQERSALQKAGNLININI